MSSDPIPVLGITPFHRPDPRLVAALVRCGATGILDLGRETAAARAALAETARLSPGPFGVRLAADHLLDPGELPESVDTVVLPASVAIGPHKTAAARRIIIQVTSLDEARAARDAGADALIVKGHESGGPVGEESSFILLQRLVAAIDLPLFVQGGLGPHTAAACLAGGAAGLVIDSQLALVRESTVPAALRAILATLDGSETVLLAGHRVLSRPDVPLAKDFARASATEVAAHLGGSDLTRELIPLGEDAALAAPLARRFATAGGVVQALRAQVRESVDLARQLEPLGPGSALAVEFGLPYPIAQGPMSRVSDRAEFSDAVQTGGGLPFTALALLREEPARDLLLATADRLAGRPWGVGLLGFVPAELQAEQLAAIEVARPPFALIAGGRPSQARRLEEAGTKTFLHVPSPGLLELFLKEGARRFIFEGREGGGHVGPRSSFPLWEAQIAQLMEFPQPEELQVVFAGGIHDARSAAMVAAMAAPLTARGMAVGVLMGTAYLFTEEAVASGAILPAYQEKAITCTDTALLETAPGHATRCAQTPFVTAFQEERDRLEKAGTEQREIWARLEEMNLGRLRLASKGLERTDAGLMEVDTAGQERGGLYMIGEVAALRAARTTVADLHREVSAGSVRHLAKLELPELESESQLNTPANIAVIGMACVFPDADDLDEFWANIVSGRDSITEVPAERWNPDIYFDPEGRAGHTTPSKWGGFLDPVHFDPASFGIPPASMASVEPAQLLSLEVARRALADAGYATREFDRERCSVLFGAEGGNDLSGALGFRALFPQYAGELPEGLDKHLPQPTEDTFPGVLANVIAGRIANRLDLGGMNYTVDAACASALAALESAVQTLCCGTSDMVLAGGADVHNSINDYLMFSSVHALSKSGRCRTFDAGADGITLGEGVGAVVLKRLADAERDGDRIYGVIRSVAGSSDGKSLGLTAPRREGQVRAIERAWKRAGRSPAEAGLVEAHGTGTVVGDRTELDSMTEVLRDAGALPGSMTLGSVKSQIGHTKCAAGIASMIKICLALHHRVLPPTLHVEEPNSSYDKATSPFLFRRSATPWAPRPANEDGSLPPRIGALSSFGFGGTNFHAVVEEHDDPMAIQTGLAPWSAELFLVRGNTPEAARELLDAIEGQLDVERPWRLRDLARSTCDANPEQPVRMAFVVHDLDELRETLREARAGEQGPRLFQRTDADDEQQTPGSVAFLFSGQGSQYPGMGADLFAAFPCLHEIMARGAPWADRIWPAQSFSPAERRAQAEALTDTRVAQPALGMVELAGARILEVCGVRPDMLAGHSYGELAALAVAGALDPTELLDLSEARGRAILDSAGDEPGTMAAVSAGPEEIGSALRGVEGLAELVLANLNAPRQTVISGPSAAIATALEHLEQAGLAARPIPVACAFHSSVVAGAEPAYAKHLAAARVSSPTIPVWSNTSATPYPENDPDAVRAQLARHLVQPVRFTDQVRAMHAAGARIFIEVGPGRVLTGLVGKILGDAEHLAVSTDARGEAGIPTFLTALARLAVAGLEIDCEPIFTGRGAEHFDLASPPDRIWPPMTWLVDGFRSRPLRGEIPATGLIPMERPPTPVVPAGSQAAQAGQAPAGSREAVVIDYLQNVRELVEAQRQVLLGYLGTTPAELAPQALAPVLATPTPVQVVPISAQAPVTPAPSTTFPPEPPTEVDLEATLLAIVSERTGYPLEMLEMDLDMEADLGIDSIKRIEILGALNEAAGLAGADEDKRDELVEQLASIKTLRGILEWIEENGDADGQENPDDTPETETTRQAPAASHRLGRFLLHMEETARPDANLSCLEDRVFCITDDGDGLARALAVKLEAAGARASLINGKSTVDFDGVDGLIHLASLPKGSGPVEVKRLFTLARQAVEADVRWIIAATGMGGGFGRDANGFGYEGQGGVAGLLKSLAKEREGLRVRALDLDPHAGSETLAEQLMVELTSDDPLVEVAWSDGKRHSLRAVATEAPKERTSSTDAAGVADGRGLDKASVVLITGGARGITARAAMELAQRSGCTLELVGRSPLPEDTEPAETSAAADEVSLKRTLAAAHPESTPAELGAEARRILAAREVRSTLVHLKENGARVTYNSLDVRDDDAFGALVDDIYTRHGRLDGVIHGAGVVEDKLLIHKSSDSFDRVFDTKVCGALTLARTLREDIGFVIFFSSISSTFGNRGQADYAAANDVLDKLAHHMNGRLAGRVCSINWGPWDSAGMVSPELRREYERRGIGLIDLAEGAASLLDEILHGDKEASQVILMSADPESFS